MNYWKRTILLLAVVMSLTLVACGIRKESVDPEKLIVQYQEALAAAIHNDEAYFRSIALLIQSCPERENAYYYYQTSKTNLSGDIQQRVASLPVDYDLNLNCIYTGGQTADIYPEDSCVFRCTVMSDDSVYCWVDLIYSENWESELRASSYMNMQEHDVLTCVAPNWCIVLFYGF